MHGNYSFILNMLAFYSLFFISHRHLRILRQHPRAVPYVRNYPLNASLNLKRLQDNQHVLKSAYFSSFQHKVVPNKYVIFPIHRPKNDSP